VQGLTLGFGGDLGLEGSRIQFRPSIAYGTSDHRLLGSAMLSLSTGGTQWSIGAARQVSDFSDLPVVAPLVNSFLAQEAGKDYGDYVLLHALSLGLRQRLGGRTALTASVGVEESQSVTTRASPANGHYRPNPPLGAGTRRIARLGLERASGGMAVHRDLQGRLALEVGEGGGNYVRGTAEGRWLVGLPGSEILSRIYLGGGSYRLPAYRSFVLGGRGTLVGEPFRAYGGRTAALAQVEWRFEVPVPALPLGSFASTGRRMTVAPFLAAGYAARALPGLPWGRSAGVRPVAGVALEWFMRLIRVEAGVGLRDGHFGITVDINRDWWGLL
jgi:hypothetical protein